MRHDEWPQLVSLFQSALNNALSPQRKNIAITAFTGLLASNPVTTFLRFFDCQPVTLSQTQLKSTLNVSELVKMMKKLSQIIHQRTQKERAHIRLSKGKVELANFSKGDSVLVAKEDFFDVEKLFLRWCGPQRIIKALSDYVFRVEDLRIANFDDIHGTSFKIYNDDDLDENTIFSPVLSSETGMTLARRSRLVNQVG